MQWVCCTRAVEFSGRLPSLLDVARLAQALDPEGALTTQGVNGARASQAAMQCAACGVALPPDPSLAGAQRGATLAISRLAQAHASVAALGPAPQAHDCKPSPEVVKRRLERLAEDVPRRRESTAQMEAEARAAGVHEDQSSAWPALNSAAARVALIALVGWLVWRFW